MGFWIFMLIMDLLLPFTMIGFGRYFMKKAPKEINSVFGYRTSMSMKNKDTWEFAHKYCGKVWYVCGMVMLPITVIFMLLVIGKNEDCVGSIGGIICGVQLIPLIGSILPTEIALKKNMVFYLLLLIDFYIVPWFIKNTGSAMIVMLVIIPLICLITSVFYGIRNGFNFWYILIVAIMFAPSIFIFYNSSAWVYVVGYAVIALLGNLIALPLGKR